MESINCYTNEHPRGIRFSAGKGYAVHNVNGHHVQVLDDDGITRSINMRSGYGDYPLGAAGTGQYAVVFKAFFKAAA